MRSARALELIQLLALAAAPRACVGRISSPPPEPPAPPPQRTARLSGNLVSERAVVAEAVASVAHHLTITLENEEFATSLAAADVVAALARAGDGDDDAGWDAAVAAAEVRWERADNRTLRVTVPQLRAFHVSHDLTVRVALPPGLLASSAPRAILAASGADGARRRARAAIQRAAASQTGASSVELGNEPPLEALPYLTIKASYPCADASDALCAGCVAYNAVGLNHSHACAWCASDRRCLPKTDLGVTSAQCSGLTVDQCGGPAGDDPAGGGGGGGSGGGSGGGGGGSAGGGTSPAGGDARDDGGGGGFVKPMLRRIGVGIHVLNLADIDLQNGRFYADFEVFMHVEVDEHGHDRLYGVDALSDPLLNECGSLLRWRPYLPEDTAGLIDAGLGLVNVDRLRQVTAVPDSNSSLGIDHVRVQSYFFFRTNVTFWPLNTEALEILLEEARDAVSTTPSALFCHMPEYSGLSPSIRLPGTIDNRLLTYSWRVVETCGPPYLQPVRQCSNEQPTLFEQMCFCLTVDDYDENVTGFDRESCGCKGGRRPTARFYFAVHFRFPELAAVLTAFLAPMVISLVNLATYLIPPSAIETRFNLCGSTLIAAVMFHVSLKQQTPQASVLTLADRVLFNVYLVIFGSFAVSTLLLSLYFAKRTKTAAAAYLLLRPVGPGASLLVLGSSDLQLPQWLALTRAGAALCFALGGAHIAWHAISLCHERRGLRAAGWPRWAASWRGGAGAVRAVTKRSASGGYENVAHGDAGPVGDGADAHGGYASGLLDRTGAGHAPGGVGGGGGVGYGGTGGAVEFVELDPLRAPAARVADAIESLNGGGAPLRAPAHVRAAQAAECARTPLEELGASRAEDALRDAASNSAHALEALARAQHELVGAMGAMLTELALLRRDHHLQSETGGGGGDDGGGGGGGANGGAMGTHGGAAARRDAARCGGTPSPVGAAVAQLNGASLSPSAAQLAQRAARAPSALLAGAFERGGARAASRPLAALERFEGGVSVAAPMSGAARLSGAMAEL